MSEDQLRLKNLTEYEIPLLSEPLNLTDGHVFRSWSPEEASIIAQSSDFFTSVNRQMQRDLERAYVEAFLTFSGQTIDFDAHSYLLCTSASMALDIVGNYLRLTQKDATLIEPCFDNLADIFRRHDVPLTPFPASLLGDAAFADALKNVKTGAICLVSPNNPTGDMLTQPNLVALIEHCRRTGTLLILDCCFRAYIPESSRYDQYQILRDSGIDYVVIEDTGKTWPTSELKAPFITVSRTLYQRLYDIYTDLLLHVSPFVLRLMTKFLQLAYREGHAHSRQVVNTNRDILYRHIQGTVLTPTEKPFISVSWLKTGGIDVQTLVTRLRERRVYVLQGNFFYWSAHERGLSYIRVALTRDEAPFKFAVQTIEQVCRELPIT